MNWKRGESLPDRGKAGPLHEQRTCSSRERDLFDCLKESWCVKSPQSEGTCYETKRRWAQEQRSSICLAPRGRNRSYRAADFQPTNLATIGRFQKRDS